MLSTFLIFTLAPTLESSKSMPASSGSPFYSDYSASVDGFSLHVRTEFTPKVVEIFHGSKRREFTFLPAKPRISTVLLRSVKICKRPTLGGVKTTEYSIVSFSRHTSCLASFHNCAVYHPSASRRIFQHTRCIYFGSTGR